MVRRSSPNPRSFDPADGSSPWRFSTAMTAVLALAATGCDARIIEAVELLRDGAAPIEDGHLPETGVARESGVRDEGSVGAPDASGSRDAAEAGASGDASCAADAPSSPTVWPNCISSANSDPWLVQHHDRLTAIRPRLLLLHFFNPWNKAQAEDWAALQIRALREGSRYHAYADPNAPAFLEYQIARTIDLTDNPPPPPTTWDYPSSTRLPVTAEGAFDTAALFTQKFADDMGAQGFADTSQPRNLTLCEIFERGLVNEVWLLVGEPQRRRPPLMLERKQAYDATGRPIAGDFVCIKGATCVPAINCRTTVRMANLDPNRGAGCDAQVRGWNIEGVRAAVPYLDTNLRAFLNADFRTRFNAPFDSFDEICDKQANPPVCVTYPTPTQAAGMRNGINWTINPFLQGCGTPEFPPNAHRRYDWANDVPVQSRCEHYGMRDGDAGQDTPDRYTFGKVAAYDTAFGKPDCGTGWQIYWRQSIPGFENRAIDADGRRMKNFWPFLFY